MRVAEEDRVGLAVEIGVRERLSALIDQCERPADRGDEGADLVCDLGSPRLLESERAGKALALVQLPVEIAEKQPVGAGPKLKHAAGGNFDPVFQHAHVGHAGNIHRLLDFDARGNLCRRRDEAIAIASAVLDPHVAGRALCVGLGCERERLRDSKRANPKRRFRISGLPPLEGQIGSGAHEKRGNEGRRQKPAAQAMHRHCPIESIESIEPIASLPSVAPIGPMK